jgi:porin
MEKLFNLTGGRVYALARGGWSNGINNYSVGSIFGVNGLEFGNEPIQLWELYYEQRLFNDTLLARFGRVDLSNGFDCHDCPATFDGNTYANDETFQFLNNSLINNPTIPFTDPGLGAILHFAPVEWFYISGAVVDAKEASNESGLNTSFSGPSHVFSIYELGFMPRLSSKNGRMHGAYRAGFWYEPQAKERMDGNGKESDDVGYYLSFDQMLFKENAIEGDTQGLGAFARYGWADGEVNDVTNFWSVGAQYQGLVERRDNDVLAVGVGQGILSRHADFTASNETALECYYNMELTPWLHVSPDIQYIFNPGGDSSVNDAVVLGVRIEVTF